MSFWLPLTALLGHLFIQPISMVIVVVEMSNINYVSDVITEIMRPEELSLGAESWEIYIYF